MDNETGKVSADRIVVVSAIIGILVGIPKFCSSALLYAFGIIEWFGLMDAGALIFKRTDFPLDFFHLTLAAITFLLWGGFIAILLALVYLLSGKRHCILKGAHFGFLIWVIFRDYFASSTLPEGFPPLNAITIATAIVSHLSWGAITGYFIAKYIPFKEDRYVQ